MTGNQYAVHSRQIAARLRQFRIESGLSGEAVANRFGWSPSKVSRIELFRTGVSLRDLRDLLDLYEVGGPEREALDSLAGKIRGRGPDDYSEAVMTQEWSVTALPAPVRTVAYARGVFRAAQPITRVVVRDIEHEIQATIFRQIRLARSENADPMLLRVCLDEAVLSRRYGDEAVMTAQLTRLTELAAQPNITLRVLPLSTPVIRPPSFSLFHFTGSETEELVMPALSVEHVEGTWVPGSDEDTYLYQVTFGHLWSLALPEDETLAVIRRLCEVSEEGLEPSRPFRDTRA